MTHDALLKVLRRGGVWHMYDREMAVSAGHAYLLLSEDEVAREEMVRLMCTRVYCPTACTTCPECRKVLGHNKPDVAEPNPQGEILRVEQAQALVEDAQMGSFEGGKKVYVLRNMHLQREAVQNVLLKTLEEPNPGVMFLLTAAHEAGILSTVRSRVKLLVLPPLPRADLEEVLTAEGVAEPSVFAKAAQGNVGLALSLSRDEHYFALVDEVVDLLAELRSSTQIPLYLYRPEWAKDAIAATLEVMEIAVRDLMYVRAGVADSVVYRGKLSVYRQIAGLYPLRSLPLVLELIEEAKRKVASYCTAVNVADSLFLSMLEVKNTCARS